MIKAKLLSKENNIIHFFYNRYQSMDFFSSPNHKKAMLKMNQTHSSNVIIVNKISNHVRSDGAITKKNFILSVKTADCLPILLYENQQKIIAAIHAGWQGLLKGIIEKAVKKITAEGAKVNYLLVAIGPHIRSCCYSVPIQRVQLFRDKSGNPANIAEKRKDLWFLSLINIASQKLLKLGVKEINIEDVGICTKCRPDFFSARREGYNTGRNISLISLVD